MKLHGALLAAVAVVVPGGGLVAAAVWYVTRRKRRMTALADKLRSTVPEGVAKWADAIVAGAEGTAPDDFPGGLDAWALFGASVMQEESAGGTAPGYRPRGEWNGTGDSGNAETPWQLDSRYHGEYLESEGRTPEADSSYAMGLLRENWDKYADISDADLRTRAAAATYNASERRVRNAIANGEDPDAATYPRGAGRYVYSTEIFSRLQDWKAA